MGGEIADEAPPWAGSSLSCIGWIPTADGHLSFSLIGHGTHPECHRCSALVLDGADEPVRKVAILQERKNADFPLLARAFEPDATQHWLLIGETRPAKYYTERGNPHPIFDKQGMLRGTCTFIPRQVDKPFEWTLIRDAIIRALRPDRSSEDPKIFRELTAACQNMRDEPLSVVTVEFALFRTGELRVWLAADQIALVETDADYRRTDLYVGLQEIPKSHTLLRQAYYFVKDAVHHHVHHHGSSDQIIPLVFHADDDANEEINGQASLCEQRWHRETVWGLSRATEELVRKGSRESLRNALGFICFAEAFQTSLSGWVRTNGHLNQFAEVSNFHRYDFKSLRESVRIGLERRTWLLAGWTAMAASTVAAALSAVIAANAVGSHAANGVKMWGPMSDWAFRYPYALPLVFVSLLVFVFFLIYSEERLVRLLSLPAAGWGRFVAAHVNYVMSGYQRRGKAMVGLVLTLACHALPIALLGSGIWLSYYYLL